MSTDAERLAALHAEAETALTTMDPFAKREVIHSVIDRAAGRYVPEEFARELIGASAEKRLLMYLAQSGQLAVRDAEIEIPKIQAEARAEGYAAGLAAAREAVADVPNCLHADKAEEVVLHRVEVIHREDALDAIDALSGSSSPHADADLAVDP